MCSSQYWMAKTHSLGKVHVPNDNTGRLSHRLFLQTFFFVKVFLGPYRNTVHLFCFKYVVITHPHFHPTLNHLPVHTIGNPCFSRKNIMLSPICCKSLCILVPYTVKILLKRIGYLSRLVSYLFWGGISAENLEMEKYLIFEYLAVRSVGRWLSPHYRTYIRNIVLATYNIEIDIDGSIVNLFLAQTVEVIWDTSITGFFCSPPSKDKFVGRLIA